MLRELPTQAATKLLLAQRLHSLHFDVRNLLFDRNIVFDTIQHYCEATPVNFRALPAGGGDGLTIVRKIGNSVCYVVLWNADVKNFRRRRFTLAHEIGHIYLGHLDDARQEEAEADAFAAQLLMPRILAEQISQKWNHKFSADVLCDFFHVSHVAAALCLHNMKSPVAYTDDDYALLQRFVALLPHPDEPLVTI